MELVHKSLRRDELKRFVKKSIKSLRVDEKGFCGTIGLLIIEEIEKPLIVTYSNYKVVVADKNYRWLQFAPKNENWWLTVLFDDKDNLIESYFDIAKINSFADEDNPTFLDMFLDVTLSKDREPVILDEDELKMALNQNLITNHEYEFAFFVAKNIIKGYNKNKAKYYAFVDRYYEKLQA
ncbi:MAG: DUF402 domain-containing protein [Roseburia sp.]|nr:DUF402 domain-containing protein [Anaeroplasma bactoclasticum]MCM1196516.1 DUF402 domain-containing protein [Roseburia sp.]MCM1557250.1 DUF402 domain-containing protein [Anaeroplasma bactoclasticum]